MNDWIKWKWTPEKPYPETLETRVNVKCKSGFDDSEFALRPETVGWWHDENPEDSAWECSGDGRITHYKVVK